MIDQYLVFSHNEVCVSLTTCCKVFRDTMIQYLAYSLFEQLLDLLCCLLTTLDLDCFSSLNDPLYSPDHSSASFDTTFPLSQ